MSTYSLTDGQHFTSQTISAEMMGANFNSVYQAATVGDDELLDAASELGFQSLRFPGGTITEYAFVEAQFSTGDWEAADVIDQTGRLVSVCGLDEFFAFAGQLHSDVTLVLPTRTAFDQSAAEALLDGTYGQRSAVTEEFIAQTMRFLDEALAQAAAHGVDVTRLELGNEFWGSGEMTAAEYAYVAEALLELIADHYPNLEVGVQITASANRFSPAEDQVVWVEEIDGKLNIIFPDSGEVPGSNAIPVTMPGNGSGGDQTDLILEVLAQNPIAAGQITGVIEHLHFDARLSDIDSQKDYALDLGLRRATEILGNPDLNFYVTEWSSKDRGNGENAFDTTDGIMYAHLLVENFFRLTSEGVDAAMVWPLHFANENIKGRTLVDAQTGDLTFGGHAMHWLFTETEGLAPLVEYEDAGGFDIHVFGADEQLLIIAASRGIETMDGQSSLDLDLGPYGPSSAAYVSVEVLYSDSEDIFSNSATPTLEKYGLALAPGEIFELEVPTWAVASASFQLITDSSEIFHMSLGDDHIDALGGDDEIYGLDGDDYLKGGEGDDLISGGNGNDRLSGGNGTNAIVGGDGFDIAYFDGAAADFRIVVLAEDSAAGTVKVLVERVDGELEVSVVEEVERLQFKDQFITAEMILDGATNSDDVLDYSTSETAVDVNGAGGSDLVIGGGRDDRLVGGSGDDVLYGNNGDDYIVDTSGRTVVDGGDGQDIVLATGHASVITDSGTAPSRAGEIDDILIAGSGDDSLSGGTGDDILIGDVSRKYVVGDDVLDGGEGNDFLEGGLGADVFVFRAGDGNDMIGNIDQGALSLNGKPPQTFEGVQVTGADFESGVDKIYLVAEGFTSISSADDAFENLYDNEDGYAVFSADGTQITFVGLSTSDLAADDFLFM